LARQAVRLVLRPAQDPLSIPFPTLGTMRLSLKRPLMQLRRHRVDKLGQDKYRRDKDRVDNPGRSLNCPRACGPIVAHTRDALLLAPDEGLACW